jgi:hypothetical protein
VNISPRGRGTATAEATPQLAHLTLPELREYRARLRQEEERVSYWRRLVHARMDVLNASRRKLGALTHEELVRALGGTALGVTRTALLAVNAADPLPELPELNALWANGIDPDDEAAAAAAHESLAETEGRLTEYRTALHTRLAEATGELITRYAAAPETCLDLLLPESVRARAV